jgi:FkbM family methyltransferase
MSTSDQRTSEYSLTFSKNSLLKSLIQSTNPHILDVGANSGSSLVTFKELWPESIIHCFEPQFECWADLEAAAQSYSRGSVTIIRSAVGSVDSESSPFYTHSLTTGQSGFNKINLNSLDSIRLSKMRSSHERIDYEASVNECRSVSVTRLDNYLQAANINKINLLKVDTQGHEPEVLEGLGKMLKSVDVVLTELMLFDFYDRQLTFTDIEKHLLPAGFHLYDICNISKNPMNGRTDWVDLLYIRR